MIPFEGMLCCIFFFLTLRVEPILIVGPNKRLHNFPLEEKVPCEARTFPRPHLSRLLGVGRRGLAEICKTSYTEICHFLCNISKVSTQMALVFSHLM